MKKILLGLALLFSANLCLAEWQQVYKVVPDTVTWRYEWRYRGQIGVGNDTTTVNAFMRYDGLIKGTSVQTEEYLIPAGDGSSGQVLKTDGAGNLSWQSDLSGGGGASALAIEEDDVQISSPTATIDFRDGLDVTESPSQEANVIVDPDEVITAGTQISWSGHTLNVNLATGTITQAYSANMDTDSTDDVVDSDFGTAGLMKTDGAGNYSVITDNSSNWNTAFGWGDHSGQGYLTSVDISDDTNLVAGTNITLSDDTLNVDDAFLSNSADDSTSYQITISSLVVTNKTTLNTSLSGIAKLTSGVISAVTIDISGDTNLVGGTNITLSDDTLNVDDAFLKNNADDSTSYKITMSSLSVTDRVGIGESSPDDWLHITGNNACIKLEDDSGNYARIKSGNSQLTLEVDPDDAVVSTDMVFKMDGAEVGRFGQGGKFGIGLTPTANMAGLSIEAGLLTLKETTTPTADANYGKIYNKNDNKLYFQDGAGTEHAIASIIIDISDDTNLVAGTNITLSGDTLNVDDAFLSNSADDSTNYKITVSSFSVLYSLTITEGALIDSMIVGADIKDDTIDSADYAGGSIDAEHLAADVIDETKIADDGIDSEHYNDGSIDAAHLAADIIDETKIADNGIDSEHYNDESIDRVHLASAIIGGGDYAVCISTPVALGTVATLMSPFRNYAVTITAISAQIIGGTNVIFMIEQRTIAGIESAGTDIWSGDVTAVPTVWTGGGVSDFTVPADSALVLVPTSVSGNVDRLMIKYRITKD